MPQVESLGECHKADRHVQEQGITPAFVISAAITAATPKIPGRAGAGGKLTLCHPGSCKLFDSPEAKEKKTTAR